MQTQPAAGIRLCIPSVAGRGAGLGNELYPWAKAWLAAQAIGGIALPPAFGLNPREYWRYFGTPRLDWLFHRALLKAMPRYRFTEQDYRSTGEQDFRKAVAVFAERLGWREKRLFVLEVGGMWGGFLGVREARDFMLARLYAARSTVENLTDWRTRLDPDHLVVAVHIRAGDFKAASESINYRGSFNRELPLSWYISVCDQLRERFGNRLQFQLLTDGQPEALAPFIQRFTPVTGFHQVDLFFHCTITGGALQQSWRDPARVVTDRRFFAQSDLELARIRFKPDSLAAAAWGEGLSYDPLERLVR